VVVVAAGPPAPAPPSLDDEASSPHAIAIEAIVRSSERLEGRIAGRFRRVRASSVAENGREIDLVFDNCPAQGTAAWSCCPDVVAPSSW
jgi:hypothetical protein